MKITNIILTIIIFINLSCSKTCTLNYEIIGAEYEIPYFKFQNQASKEIDKIDYDRYELINIDESEIPYIMDILHSQITEIKLATEFIINNLCEYSVQIAGIHDSYSGAKSIYLNFEIGYIDFETINANDEYTIGKDGEKMRFIETWDGEDSNFQAIINTRTNKLRIVFINGEA